MVPLIFFKEVIAEFWNKQTPQYDDFKIYRPLVYKGDSFEPYCYINREVITECGFIISKARLIAYLL